MSLNNSIITQSIGIPYQQYVTSSAGHTLISSSTYFNNTSDNIPRYKDASGNIYDAIISSSYALTASHALNSGGGGSAFPFTGDAQITGSLTISGSFNAFRIDSDDIILGNEAGQSISSIGPSYNVFIGERAGGDITTGGSNVIIGREAGYLANQGRNTTIGYLAGRGWSNTSGENVTMGYYAGYNAATTGTGTHNTLLGAYSGRNLTTGTGNVYIGHSAGFQGAASTGNIIIGSGSLGAPAYGTPINNQLRIGNADLIAISGSLETGDVIFASTASAAYFVGDGSGLTNVSGGGGSTFPFTGDAQITGSLIVSGSSFGIDSNADVNITSSGNMTFKTTQNGGYLELMGTNNVGMRMYANSAGGTYINNISFENTSVSDSFIKVRANSNIVTLAGVGGNTPRTVEINPTAAPINAVQYALGVKGYRGSGTMTDSILTDAGSDTSANYALTARNKSGDNILRVRGDKVVIISGSLVASGSVVDFTDATAISGSTFSGSFAGDGSQLTNLPGGGGSAFPFTGDAQITGSLIVSGSFLPHGNGNIDGVVIGENAAHIGTGALNTGHVAIGDTAQANMFGVAIGASATAGVDNISIGYRAGANYGVNSRGVIAIGTEVQPTTNADNSINFSANDQNITEFSPSEPKTFGVYLGSSTADSPDLKFKVGPTSGSYWSGSGYFGFNTKTPDASLTVYDSGSTVFNVIGSEGTLFSVDDDLSGTLFTANDISGLPVLEASASGEVYIGKSPQSLYTTAVISSTSNAVTQSIFGLSTSSYDGAFFDYTVQSGSDARAGSIMSVWNGSNISFTETTTLDIGDTSGFNLIVHISQSQAQIAQHSDTNGYKIKTIIRSI